MFKNLWTQTVNFCKTTGKKALALVGIGTASAVAVTEPAHALPTTMSDIFLAADVSTLQTNVGTLLLAFVAISLLFVGMRYLRKAGIR